MTSKVLCKEAQTPKGFISQKKIPPKTRYPARPCEWFEGKPESFTEMESKGVVRSVLGRELRMAAGVEVQRLDLS